MDRYKHKIATLPQTPRPTSETERSNSSQQPNDARSSTVSTASKTTDVGRPAAFSAQRKEIARDKSVDRETNRTAKLNERPAKNDAIGTLLDICVQRSWPLPK